jgi:hypothetical protein
MEISALKMAEMPSDGGGYLCRQQGRRQLLANDPHITDCGTIPEHDISVAVLWE